MDIKNFFVDYNKKYNINESYILNEQGLKFIKEDKDGNKTEIILTTVPFYIEAKFSNRLTNDKKIEIIYFENWKKYSIIIDLDELMGQKILKLSKKGLMINVNNYKVFNNFFSEFWNFNYYKLPEVITSNQMGWVDDEFVPYSNKIKFDVNDDLKEEISWIETKGNKKDWIDKVKEYRENKHFRFLLDVGYASVLLKLLHGRSMVIHNTEMSKSGKTTAAYFGLSIWGNPDKNKIPYDSSLYAIETKISLRNNLPSLLDENVNMTTEQLNKLIYMIGNGKNNSKGTPTGLRKEKTWNCFVYSTAEIPLIRDEQNEGIYNRTLEGKWRPFKDKEKVKEAYDFLVNNYGHTGKEFIKYIIKNKNSLQTIKERFEVDLKNTNKLDEHIRIISIICLADYITKIFFGGSYEESLNLGKFILKDLININDMNTSKKAIEVIKEWIIQNENRFKRTNKDDIREPIGYIQNDTYYLYTGTVKELLEKKGFNYKKTKDYFKTEQLALFDKKGDFKLCYVNKKYIRMIQLTEKFWKNEETEKNINENIDFNKFLFEAKKINLEDAEKNRETIYKLAEIFNDLNNRLNHKQLDIFSKESQTNQGETLNKIVNQNVINSISDVIAQEFKDDKANREKYLNKVIYLENNINFIKRFSGSINNFTADKIYELIEYLNNVNLAN